MTLDKAVVDLSQCFAFGQAYVALSRARSLRGLKIEGLGEKSNGMVMSDEVREFLEEKFGLELG